MKTIQFLENVSLQNSSKIDRIVKYREVIFRIIYITKYADFRSRHRRCSIRKGVLRNFAKFTGKHLCQSLLLKKRLWHMCFPENFVKFLRTSFLQNTSGRLLLRFKINSTTGIFLPNILIKISKINNI